jgi:hypothetical protein
MKLLHSEPFNTLVKSTVEIDGKTYDVLHFDLSPDETGIFSLALTLHNAPPFVEPESTKPDEKDPIEEPLEKEPVVFNKKDLDKAISVASKLNKLGVVEIEKSIDSIENVNIKED